MSKVKELKRKVAELELQLEYFKNKCKDNYLNEHYEEHRNSSVYINYPDLLGKKSEELADKKLAEDVRLSKKFSEEVFRQVDIDLDRVVERAKDLLSMFLY